MRELKGLFEIYQTVEKFVTDYKDKIDLLSDFPGLSEKIREIDSISNFLDEVKAVKFPMEFGKLKIIAGRGMALKLDSLKEDLNRVKWFSENIAVGVSEGQNSELERLYSEMVLSNKLDSAEFLLRFNNYKKVFDNLLNLDVLSDVLVEDGGREVFVKNIRTSLENFCVEEIIEFGRDPIELEKQILENFVKVRETARVSVNLHYSSLYQVLKSGHLKTYNELEDKRRDVVNIFGKKSNYSKNRRERDAEIGYDDSRFVVGAMSSENGYDEFIGPAPFYGHGSIVFKSENIDGRVAYFEGDSLGGSKIAGEMMPRWLYRKHCCPLKIEDF